MTYVQTQLELAEELQNEVQGGTINTEVLETSPPIIAYTLLFPYQAGHRSPWRCSNKVTSMR